MIGCNVLNGSSHQSRFAWKLFVNRPKLGQATLDLKKNLIISLVFLMAFEFLKRPALYAYQIKFYKWRLDSVATCRILISTAAFQSSATSRFLLVSGVTLGVQGRRPVLQFPLSNGRRSRQCCSDLIAALAVFLHLELLPLLLESCQ